MSKIVQADNINAGQYYLNGQPLTTGGGEPHAMLPVGSIIMWPTSSPPSNWLLCNGDPVPSSSPLYAIMTTRPNFRGRFPAMNGDPGDSGSYIGSLNTATVNKNIGISQMPSHSHSINDPGHNHRYEYLTAIIGSTPDLPSTGIGTTSATNPTTEEKTGITGTNDNGGFQPYAPPYYSINFIIYAGAPTS